MSQIEYTKLSVPTKPAVGVYVMVPLEFLTAFPLVGFVDILKLETFKIPPKLTVLSFAKTLVLTEVPCLTIALSLLTILISRTRD